jgi:Flp pilus assembly protein TadB
MTVAPLAAVALMATAAWIWWSAPSPADRLRAIRTTPTSHSRSGVAGSRAWSSAVFGWTGVGGRTGTSVGVRQCGAASAMGIVGFLVLEGVGGALTGAALAGVTLLVLRGRQTPCARREIERIGADLPFAADLMVACLKAGHPLVGAVETAAAAIGGPLGHRLSWVSGQLRLGAHPEDAWSSLSDEPPVAQLARTMIRASVTGSPVADALTRLGDDAAVASRATSSAAARRVAVQVVAPLGLCFLPAFVLLGIVPVIAALAAQVLVP